jgi:hypothetical protein
VGGNPIKAPRESVDSGLEDRARLEIIAEPIPLTDPAPAALQTVCAGWRLALEPAAAIVDHQ